jgi:hypothetical protein
MTGKRFVKRIFYNIEDLIGNVHFVFRRTAKGLPVAEVIWLGMVWESEYV